jgi:hypothetical protein
MRVLPGFGNIVTPHLYKESFDDLILRHGQYVRWMQMEKCACVANTGKPDLKCTVCGGDGMRYHFDTVAREYDREVPLFSESIVRMPTGHRATKVTRLRDSVGADYTPGTVTGTYLKFTGPRHPAQYEKMFVTYERGLKESGILSGSYQGAGVAFIEGTGYPVAGGSVHGDIVAVRTLVNHRTAVSYTISSFFNNRIIFTFGGGQEPNADDILVADIDFIRPVMFAILSQTKSRQEQKFLVDIGGDATCTFPNSYRVADMDYITLCVGTRFAKRLLTKQPGDYDNVPEYYVADVPKVTSFPHDDANTYVEGTDYILSSRNQIRWISGHRPTGGEQVYVFFEYFPTYSVLKDMPSVRSQENQQFPRRVALKMIAGGMNRGNEI